MESQVRSAACLALGHPVRKDAASLPGMESLVRNVQETAKDMHFAPKGVEGQLGMNSQGSFAERVALDHHASTHVAKMLVSWVGIATEIVTRCASTCVATQQRNLALLAVRTAQLLCMSKMVADLQHANHWCRFIQGVRSSGPASSVQKIMGY